MKYRLLPLFICLFLISPRVSAQQTWGIAGSNYAGVSNVDLNPSLIVSSRLGWDLNLAGFDASLYNNSFYTDPQFVIPLLFKSQINFATANTESPRKLQTADIVIKDNIQPTTFVNINAVIKGPSYMRTNGFSAWALTSSYRAGVSTFNLPRSSVKMAYENLNYPPLENEVLRVEKGIAGGAMSWLELAGSYARNLTEGRKYVLFGGISLKAMIGYNGGYAVSRGTDYMVPYRGNFTAINLNMDYGHAINQKSPGSLTDPKGAGGAMDIGFTIMHKKKGRSTYYGCPMMTRKTLLVSKNYNWKFGMSLIDFGGIMFSQKAIAYSYSNVSYSWDSIQKTKAKTIEEVDQKVYNNFAPYGAAAVKTSFFMWAPTAVSMQLDINYNNLFYMNLSAVQRVVFTDQARLARMNSIAFTPRYETPDLEFSLPIIMNEYRYMNVGAMVRYKSFFIGTDQLASTFGMTTVNGLDLYMGIKLSHFGAHSEPRFRFF